MSHRTEKFASTLKQCLAEILMFESDNRDFKSVSITQVLVTGDLKNARILVSSYSSDPDGLIDELAKASGYLKRMLARKMYMKYMPELTFVKDQGFEMDQKMAHPFPDTENGEPKETDR